MSAEALNDRHERARRRALRAARAVTLGIFAMGGCANTVTESSGDAAPEDAAVAASEDVAAADAGLADVAADVPRRCDQDGGSEAWTRCCTEIGWDWNRGCEAWGPLAPPAMEA